MNIYVLTALNIVSKTTKMIENELKIHNITNDKQLSLEEYKNFRERWNKYDNKYKITCSDENAYFLKEEDALYAAKNNLADINECGSYNYIVVVGVEEGRMYTNVCPRAFYVFKYNADKKIFEELDKNDEIYEFLAIGYNATLLKGEPKIVLNMTKEDEVANKDFAQSLKENFEKKDYAKVKELIDSQETSASDSINEFLNDVSANFENIGRSIQNFVDFFNGNNSK